MIDDHIQELPVGVQHWLDYQITCGRSMLLSESYLTHPVGEFLRFYHSGLISPEWTIPEYKDSGRGRPRQLDFAMLGRDKGRLVAALEAKWVGATQVPLQYIVDDLLRLEGLRANGQMVHRYFLVAGFAGDFDKCFASASVNLGGGARRGLMLEPLLGFKSDTTLEVDVVGSREPWRKWFANFAATHGASPPKALATQLVSNVIGTGVRVALWRVLSVHGRRECGDLLQPQSAN